MEDASIFDLLMRFGHFRKHFDVVQHRSPTILMIELDHFSAVDEPKHVVASSIDVLVLTKNIEDIHSMK